MKKEILSIIKAMTKEDEQFTIEILEALEETYDVIGLIEDMQDEEYTTEEDEEEAAVQKLDKQLERREYEIDIRKGLK